MIHEMLEMFQTLADLFWTFMLDHDTSPVVWFV
jgi:hypothetical protein